MSKGKLSTQPYKGSRDFYPKDMAIRNYIFDNWKKVCKKYGFEEYDGPFLEAFEIYAAKSGGEIVNEQLYSFTDKGNRKIAIRPEMTPTISRMIAGKINELPQPIKWFSIPNLWRYEKPQKGRLREHFQLNVDTFGNVSIEADAEIISIVIDLIKEFGATEKMFKIRYGNRRLTESVFEYAKLTAEQKRKISKVIDKKSKVSKEDFKEMLEETGIDKKQVDILLQFMETPSEIIKKLSPTSPGVEETTSLGSILKMTDYDKYTVYDPTIIRGFDYYTGTVFELYDLSPDNNRAMCGGGRYDNLVELFVNKSMGGVGFGMGDVTFKNFLESWKLLPELKTECEYFVTLWPNDNPEFLKVSLNVTQMLREKGKNVNTWVIPKTKLDKQLKYADKKGYNYAIIIGEEELRDETITVKNLLEKSQETKPLEKFLTDIE